MARQSARDDPVEPGEVGIAVHREAVDRDAGAQQPHTDRTHLLVTVPDAGLDVLTPLEGDAEIRTGPDHRFLHPTQVRRGVWFRAEVEDRVAHELAGSVEREGASPVDPMDLGAARGHLVR